MQRIVVTGVAGSVGSRVASRLRAHPDVQTVVGVDLQRLADDFVDEMHLIDLRSSDLSVAFSGASTVIHLASSFGPSSDGIDVSGRDLAITRRTLRAASEGGAKKLIVLSSAMVYGAKESNPVPLTEQALVGPNDDFAFATHKAEVERLAREWEASGSGSVAVLRPTTAVAAGESSWVARTMRVSAGLSSDNDPPVQFLHLDDLADAVVLAATRSLSGVYNVAPDGWVRGEEVRQLSGRAPRMQLSAALASRMAERAWRLGVAPTPPGILPYTTHPWVVANDRLRAEGWEPAHTNVEAYVEGFAARPWAMMNSRRRQQVAIGAVGGAAAITLAAGAAAARRFRGR